MLIMNEKNTMVRPCKCRQIHGIPGAMAFKPAGKPLRRLKQVVLGPDEFEAIRLADMEGLYQEEAAEKMGISRATFGRIVEEARRKIATALVQGRALIIQLAGTEPVPARTYVCRQCGSRFVAEEKPDRNLTCPHCEGSSIIPVPEATPDKWGGLGCRRGRGGGRGGCGGGFGGGRKSE